MTGSVGVFRRANERLRALRLTAQPAQPLGRTGFDPKRTCGSAGVPIRTQGAPDPGSSEDPTMDGTADLDLEETQEWLDALDGVLVREGPERAHFLIEQLIERARRAGADLPFSANTAYVNTIPVERQPPLPGRLRARAAHPPLHPLERHGHGGARQPRHQRGRPHRQLRLGGDALRHRLQPLLALADQGARRRPGLHPGPLGAGHLRPRLPARPRSPRSSSTTSGRRSTARGSPPTRTPG